MAMSQEAVSPFSPHAHVPVSCPLTELKILLRSNTKELSLHSAHRPLGLLSSCDSFYLQVLDTVSNSSLLSLSSLSNVSPAQFATLCNSSRAEAMRSESVQWFKLQCSKIILRSALNQQTGSHQGDFHYLHESHSSFWKRHQNDFNVNLRSCQVTLWLVTSQRAECDTNTSYGGGGNQFSSACVWGGKQTVEEEEPSGLHSENNISFK